MPFTFWLFLIALLVMLAPALLVLPKYEELPGSEWATQNVRFFPGADMLWLALNAAAFFILRDQYANRFAWLTILVASAMLPIILLASTTGVYAMRGKWRYHFYLCRKDEANPEPDRSELRLTAQIQGAVFLLLVFGAILNLLGVYS